MCETRTRARLERVGDGALGTGRRDDRAVDPAMLVRKRLPREKGCSHRVIPTAVF